MFYVYRIALAVCILSIAGWYLMPVSTIMEQIYGITVLMASVVIPYILVKLIEGPKK